MKVKTINIEGYYQKNNITPFDVYNICKQLHKLYMKDLCKEIQFKEAVKETN